MKQEAYDERILGNGGFVESLTGVDHGHTGAKAVFCYLAEREYGYTGKEAGTIMGLGSSGVSIAVRRGEALVKNDPYLRKIVTGEQG